LFLELRGAAKYVIDLCAIVRIEDEKLLCDKCGMFYFNIIEHILFSCDLFVELREDLTYRPRYVLWHKGQSHILQRL
jgi:hypothetical protein